jgi:predicted ATPase/class 3 adenylate cyclase
VPRKRLGGTRRVRDSWSVAGLACGTCGAENEPGRKFCGECGTALATPCPQCGSPNAPTVKFCGECGTRLDEAAPAAAAAPPRAAPVSERRLVSVLFADLVGFTSLSESRDAEEVREFLTRYFETCRTLITRYGGTVEKFIGDAVMAVWGTPTAREDDAERAVRAAVELTAAVSALGQEAGAPELRARAGVLTGEAAVTIGAEGQGMVAGDLVNTASRIQSAADPGTVLVGESTRRATEAAVAYEDAGLHELKGKSESVQLWRALRITAGLKGALKSSVLEAPFVGRERELRLLKELFHASGENGKAQLVTITGIAGIGKSRLSWEFFKYIDGLADDVWWHRGRCLSYGEGVAYWALAEMVRMRCEIVEDEEPASAREKLRATLEEHLADEEERRWVEPRLAHLLGLEEGAPGDQENLFSAWRILFERLSEESPVVLVFEDMQWADAGLLDFLEYLLEWSRSHPLYVLALARPELTDKRPSWGAGKRNFTSLYLEPLSALMMNELLAGLVPGLPEDLRSAILQRAEGVPLYAVETVRMLIDRGLLVQHGNVYQPAGPIDTLEVPETLHALIAARLDGLSAEERALVQDAAVLGKTFTKQGISSLSGAESEQLEQLLGALLRKEILTVQADPRSPERGQYAFLQDIVKHVAYETLSRHERKARHLAAARHLETASSDEDEIVEVIAAHYVDAYNAAPDDPDAGELRETARKMLVRAGDRAASLAATAEAQHAYERAVELADDPLTQADLYERAGLMAHGGARLEASTHWERAISLFGAAGATHPAARVNARLAEVMWDRGRLEQGVESMDRAYQVLAEEEADADLAALAAQLGRFLFFAGRHEAALQRIETALELAEALALPETFSAALNTKAIILVSHGRRLEGLALLQYALDVALDHDKPSAALRAYYNLADTLSHLDRYEDAETAVRDGLAFAHRVGNRRYEQQFLGQSYSLFCLGQWDDVLEWASQLPQDENWVGARQGYGTAASVYVIVNVHRGRLDEAERITALLKEFLTSGDAQERTSHRCGTAALLLAQGDATGALALADEVIEASAEMGYTQEYVKESLVIALEAALQLHDLDRVEQLLAMIDGLPPGKRAQFLEAVALRFHGRLAELTGDPDAERFFKRAAGLYRELGIPFYLACTELDHARWLTANGRDGEADELLAEAREIFERLGAQPWLERADQAQAAGDTAVAT